MKDCLVVHRQNNLQRCIKALLLDADSNRLMEAFLSGQYVLTEDQLVRQLRHEYSNYTLDQVRAIAHMYRTLWKMPGETNAHVHYSQHPTLFNMLLHFVDNGLLHMDDEEPVCQREGLLMWHELTTSIGEDVMVCAYLAGHDLIAPRARRRQDFNWMPYLRTDDVALNMLLDMPLADIHAHLKGSSMNFEINWICLMNHIDGRSEKFSEIEKEVQSDYANEKRREGELYGKAVLAAAIRLHLLELLYYKNSSIAPHLDKLMKGCCEAEVISEANKLQTKIENIQQRIGRVYQSESDGEEAIFDYAIINGSSVDKINSLTLLSGERYLLYTLMRNIYSGIYNEPKISFLFYLYLVIKNEIRHEIIQLNSSVGFDNFSIYEDRKQIFVKGHRHYENAAVHLAIKGFFGEANPSNRYHEVRITPSNSGKEIVKNIQKLDRAIENDLLKKEKTQWNYKYIFHFIKMPDEPPTSECRHYQLRQLIKKQSCAIRDYRNNLERGADNVYVADRAVGIDAANSEIACRPEVFAQAFRFLRHHTIEHPEIHRPHDLGITYHVGEDFMDVVDGLRAVTEAIKFLQLRNGDRIGHGLVLGVDVEEYYKVRNYTITMSLQMMMDNMAWLHHYVRELKGYGHVLGGIKETFENCYRRVYCKSQVPSIDIYYSSMLLRGDAPECYKVDGSVVNRGGDFAEWLSKLLNSEESCMKARKLREARKLYHQYHYDLDGKRNGEVYDEWMVTKDMIGAIQKIQWQLLNEVETMGLAIECNPTSNRKIGEFDRYDQHPILKFNNDGLNLYPKRTISVSINTDDKGVFATSIEREYALIAYAFIRHFNMNGNENCYHEVYDWIDRIRLNSLSQRFDKEKMSYGDLRKETVAKYRAQILEEAGKKGDDVNNRRFIERLRYCWYLLFGKRNG